VESLIKLVGQFPGKTGNGLQFFQGRFLDFLHRLEAVQKHPEPGRADALHLSQERGDRLAVADDPVLFFSFKKDS
jgi:hypothetical protein